MAGLEGGPVPTVATRSLLNIVVIVLVAAAPVLDPVVRLKRREVLPQDVGSGDLVFALLTEQDPAPLAASMVTGGA